jgi:hypothetical protein
VEYLSQVKRRHEESLGYELSIKSGSTYDEDNGRLRSGRAGFVSLKTRGSNEFAFVGVIDLHRRDCAASLFLVSSKVVYICRT